MRQQAGEPERSGSRVLLLDDDAAERKLLLELFSEEGAEVVVCARLRDVHAAVERYPRAVVVADSWTPGDYEGLGGQQRREIDDLGHKAPLILITGREWARRIAPAELGAVAVVSKPYDVDDLLERVRAAQGSATVVSTLVTDEVDAAISRITGG